MKYIDMQIKRRKEDCSTQEDIFNYPQNDKSEAAENPFLIPILR